MVSDHFYHDYHLRLGAIESLCLDFMPCATTFPHFSVSKTRTAVSFGNPLYYPNNCELEHNDLEHCSPRTRIDDVEGRDGDNWLYMQDFMIRLEEYVSRHCYNIGIIVHCTLLTRVFIAFTPFLRCCSPRSV